METRGSLRVQHTRWTWAKFGGGRLAAGQPPLLSLARVFARYLHSDESVCPPRVFRVSVVAMSGLVLAFVWIVNWAAGESMLFAWVEEKILARVESLAELTNSKWKSSSSDLTYLLFSSIQSLLSLHPIHNLYLILDRGAGKVGDS